MECIFCAIAEHKRAARIIYEDDSLIAFHDIHPQAPVHVLIIPREHIARIGDMQESDATLVGKMIYTATRLAGQLGVSDSGYRLVFNNGRDGGQHVYHIHLHLLGGRRMGWPPG